MPPLAIENLKLVRTDSTSTDFVNLVRLLDAELAVIDGDDHAFYAQYNKIEKIKYAIVLYEGNEPLGCGAIKEMLPRTMELKRMYTTPERRGKGVASRIITELESWASELHYSRLVLETGIRQPDAINLYKHMGYVSIPNYGQYHGIETSVCFEKVLVAFG